MVLLFAMGSLPDFPSWAKTSAEIRWTQRLAPALPAGAGVVRVPELVAFIAPIPYETANKTSAALSGSP
jgi:hypothetical protein